jgi:hypothetical protein
MHRSLQVPLGEIPTHVLNHWGFFEFFLDHDLNAHNALLELPKTASVFVEKLAS